MARIRTGNPNGRPAAPLQGREHIDMLMKNVPADVVQELDDLRNGTETRKDVIIKLIREAHKAKDLAE